MEQVSVWIAFAVGIGFPIIGWIFNTLITNKINAGDKRDSEIVAQQNLDRELFFKKFDEIKGLYVKKDLYDQALEFHQKEIDAKFENLISTMNSSFKNVETDIKEVKDLINEKFKK